MALVELLAGFGPTLNMIGVAAAAVETYLGVRHERQRLVSDDASEDRHLGNLVRLGHLCSGAIPLMLRLFATTSPPLRAVAAVSALVGSLASRYGWLAAGRRSAIAVYETVGR